MELDDKVKAKVAAYRALPVALEPIRQTPILFLVGISGAGKDTVLHRLMALHPNEYRFIVSHTTRSPRENHGVLEQNNVDYHFVDPKSMAVMLDAHAFIESKLYAGNIYGTSIAEIEKAQQEHKIATTDITTDGADEYAEFNLNAKNVFLLPPSYEKWQQRLLARYEGKVHKRDLYKRMETALAEIEHALHTDYFYIVINDDLDKTVELVSRIAHGEQVEPHYHKAVLVAEEIVGKIRVRLAEMG